MAQKPKTTKFERMIQSLAAVSCRQAGQSYADIDKSAGRKPGTARRWVRRAGFKNRGGKLRHVSEQIVDTLLEG